MKKQTIVLQIIVLLLVLGLAITGASIAHFNSPKTTKDNTTTVENTTANYTKNFSEDFYNDISIMELLLLASSTIDFSQSSKFIIVSSLNNCSKPFPSALLISSNYLLC